MRLHLIGCTAVAKFDDAAEPARGDSEFEADLAGDVAERVAALIAVGLASGSSPQPTLSSTIRTTRGKGVR